MTEYQPDEPDVTEQVQTRYCADHARMEYRTTGGVWVPVYPEQVR